MSPARRLIVNADDFGRTHSINAAVIRGHREGILTSASLMVNEPGFEEAVELAKENPGLGIGLHLTLLCGHATSPPDEIPGLVDAQGRFPDHPVRAGFRYFFRRSLRPQLTAEIAAQYQKFRGTGLKADHVNGHLHLHLHPVVFRILTDPAHGLDIARMRLTCDPFWLNTRLARGRWLYRLSHALIYRLLSSRARPTFRRRNIRHTAAVFGLLQNAGVHEEYVANLIPHLPPGDSELYSHPSLDEPGQELDALVSPKVKALIDQYAVKLIHYQDL